MSSIDVTAEDVRHAFRLLLGREPGADVVEHFLTYARAHSLSPEALARQLMVSDEYLMRNAVSRPVVEVDFGDYAMFVGSGDNDIGAAVRNRLYEPHVVSVVKEILRPGDTFVDVGANIGFFMALGAKLVGPTGRVVAIEPMDKNIQLISATIWRNGFDHVEVLPFAASSKSQMLAMVTNDGTSNGEVRATAGLGSAMPNLFAHARALDEVLGSIDRVDLVKFDIEGYELFAWQGFKHGMQKHRPVVLTEFHPHCMRRNAGIDPLDYLDVLFEYGNEVEVLVAPGRRQVHRDAGSVMSAWSTADAGWGGKGTSHLDLMVRPRSTVARP